MIDFRTTTLLAALAALSTAAGTLGCSSSNSGGGGSGDGGGSAVTFTEVYTTVLKPTCSGCHSANATDKFLDFSTQANAYAALMAAPSGPACGSAGLTTHVVPGDAATSLLYEKVSQATPPCGKQMPYGGPPLSTDDQTLIEDWINAGALND